MASLIITHKRSRFSFRLPYQIAINSITIGVMTTDEVRLNLPAADYEVCVRFGSIIPVGKRQLDLSLSSTRRLRLSDNATTHLLFEDKERWWNILFDIDLVMWIVSLIITIPSPWNIVYHVSSDIIFIIWLVRLISVRKHYYKTTTYQQTINNKPTT